MDVSELIVGAQESGSLPRVAGPAKDFVRGSINNRPFRPGGLDDSKSLERVLPDGASNGEWVHELLIGGSAQAVPPSFKQGLDLGDLKVNLTVIWIESCKIEYYRKHNIDRRAFLEGLSMLVECV